MTVGLAGWVDRGSFRPNPGQFPIRVERHLNAFVGVHLPGVTTVTAAARYYALHGLIAHLADEEQLDEASTLRTLRRTEALLAYVTRVHSGSATHAAWAPSAHGADAIARVAQSTDGLDLGRAAEVYSEAKWAFANPYRGSELTLKILDPRGFVPGAWFNLDAARDALQPVVEVARGQDHIPEATAAELASACLCTTPVSKDGEWLASLLSGDPESPPDRLTAGGLLWQFGVLTRVAMQVGAVKDAASLSDLIMFSSDVRDHPELDELVAPLRWRGALLRKESVYALRLIWRDINRRVQGATPVDDLISAFADALPDVGVTAFRSQLPATAARDGQPLAAERQLEQLSDLEQWFAVLMLGADRHDDLRGEELRGFRSNSEASAGSADELSPAWFAQQLEDHSQVTMRDLGRHLATAMLRRSQRVALWKSRFDVKSNSLTFPARLHVRDGVAIRVYEETAPVPATRIPQYLSIARQAGIFETDGTGTFRLGPHGGRLA
jgi:hypothetical protein